MPGLRLDTLNSVWANTVAKYPGKVGLVMGERRCTFEELEGDIARLAGRMGALGVQPGDHVAVAMPNCWEHYIAYWAALRVGAVLAPINHRLGPAELGYVLGNLAPKLVVIHADTAAIVAPHLPANTGVLGVAVPNTETVADAIAAGPAVDAVPRSADDYAIVAHTSGTTGVPKGALMRHSDLLFNIRNTVMPFSWRHEDVNLLLSPLFHVVALYSIVPSSAYLGATVVVAPRPDAREVVDLLESERVTNFLSTPTFHHLVLDLPDIGLRDLSALRMVGYSGAPMPVRTIERLAELVPHARLHNFFGLTETISLTHITPADCAVSHAESIGKVIPEVGTRIVDEDGRDCPRGAIGRLLIARENTIVGYLNRPGLIEESLIDDGRWFDTGDLARVDEQGFYYLEGRRKDMIIVAGENVFALEVERCLLDMEGVREAAVIGVAATGPRAALGELVKAVVVPMVSGELTVRDIRRHCVERLASYKVPQVIVLAESLPRNPSGKVLKQQLRDLA